MTQLVLVTPWQLKHRSHTSETFPNSPSSRQAAFSSSSLVTCVIIDGEWSIRSVTQTQGRYSSVKLVRGVMAKKKLFIFCHSLSANTHTERRNEERLQTAETPTRQSMSERTALKH